jgi:hypothetical protein
VRPGEHLDVLVPVDCELSNIAIVTLWPRERRSKGKEREGEREVRLSGREMHLTAVKSLHRQIDYRSKAMKNHILWSNVTVAIKPHKKSIN